VADGPHPKKLKIKYMLKTDHASSSILRTWKLTGRCSGRCSFRTSTGTLSSLKSSSCFHSVPRGKCRNNISIRPRQLLPSKSFRFISHYSSYHSTLYSLNTVTCYATEDTVRIVNSFIYNLTQSFFPLCHIYTAYNLTIQYSTPSYSS
jgi:hypothetical protein